MTTYLDPCQLNFPIQKIDIQGQENLIVRDIDVVGVGPYRRQLLLQQAQGRPFILWTHEKFIPLQVLDIYRQELVATLQWLRPLKLISQEHFDFLEEQKKIFEKIFIKTSRILGTQSQLLADKYLKDLEWNHWLLQDHWRYFVGFLRQNNSHSGVAMAQQEWAHAWVEIQPFCWPHKENNVLFINPTLQIISDVESEVRAIFYCPQRHQIFDFALNIQQALLLDLMREERKFSPEQLIEQALLSDRAGVISKREEGAIVVQSLLDSSLLLRHS